MLNFVQEHNRAYTSNLTQFNLRKLSLSTFFVHSQSVTIAMAVGFLIRHF